MVNEDLYIENSWEPGAVRTQEAELSTKKYVVLS